MSTETEQITNGELSRAVALIRSDIRDVKNDVSSRPTSRDFGFLEERIKDLEEWQKWAMRIGVPGIIGVIINFIDTVGGQVK